MTKHNPVPVGQAGSSSCGLIAAHCRCCFCCRPPLEADAQALRAAVLLDELDFPGDTWPVLPTQASCGLLNAHTVQQPSSPRQGKPPNMSLPAVPARRSRNRSQSWIDLMHACRLQKSEPCVGHLSGLVAPAHCGLLHVHTAA